MHIIYLEICTYSSGAWGHMLIQTTPVNTAESNCWCSCENIASTYMQKNIYLGLQKLLADKIMQIEQRINIYVYRDNCNIFCAILRALVTNACDCDGMVRNGFCALEKHGETADTPEIKHFYCNGARFLVKMYVIGCYIGCA